MNVPKFKYRTNSDNKDSKKLAVLLPGMGYTVQKPLLYYAKNMAMTHGYHVIEIKYDRVDTHIPTGIAQAYKMMLPYMKEFNWNAYEQIIFIEKSIGTVLGHRYAGELSIPASHFSITPLPQTFDYLCHDFPCFLLHGNHDKYMNTHDFLQACDKLHKNEGQDYWILDNANHSMEIGDTIKDLENMKVMMMLLQKMLCIKGDSL